MYFGNNAFSKKWGLHTEAQYRLFKASSNPNQLLLRIGVNYYSGKNTMLTAGYAYIKSWAFVDPDNYLAEEDRIWQQFIGKTKWLSHFQEHRFRLEQRWISLAGIESYRNRIRYRIFWSIPLNSKELEKGTFMLGFYDEIFINYTESELFDQNRLYGALGYYLNDQISFQVGYLLLSTKAANFNQVQFAIFFNPKLYKELAIQG